MKHLPPPEKTDPFAAISQPQPEAPIKRGRGRPPTKALKPSVDKRLKQHRGPRLGEHRPSPEMRQTIENMAGYGLDVLTIAQMVGVSAPLLYRHYGNILKTATAKKDLMVLQSAFLNAVGGPEQDWKKADPAMQRWWIERRQGWAAPPQRIISERMDLSKLNDRQLDELERIMEAAALDAGRDQAGEGE